LSSILLSKNINIRIHRTIILLLVLYKCGTCSLTFREDHRLREFENRVLRKLLMSERDEVRKEWERLHMEELHDLYSSPNIIRAIKSRRTK
jgi:cell division protein FtsL